MSNRLDDPDIARCRESMKCPGAVFCFGSNRAGIHGKGSALVAQRLYGAVRGVGEGLRGQSYAIPTKETWRSRGLPLSEIKRGVDHFLAFARTRPLTAFVVTRIGCGNAGHVDADIAPLFRDAPENCELPAGWRELTR